MAEIALSVIIATRDKSEDLTRCLSALAKQTIVRQIEVVVVDDGSRGDVEGIVLDHAERGCRTKYVRQGGKGAALARDRGSEDARAALLAYLDDDAVPKPTWAAAVVAAFQDWECSAIAGRILLCLQGPAPDWLHGRDWRFLSELDLGDKPLWLRSRELPYSANCAVTRTAFQAAGGFAGGAATRMSHTLSTGEDTAFFGRLRAMGGSIAYAPDACVEHVVPARRLSTEWFIRRAIAQGASTTLTSLGRAPSHRRRLEVLIRVALWFLVRAPATLIRDTLLRRGTIGSALLLAYGRGALFSVIKLRPPAADESL